MRLCLLICLLFMGLGSLYAYPRCSADLESAVRTIYQFPAGRHLIEQVEAMGPISVYRAPFASKSHAMWVTDDRSIVLNARSRRSFGEEVRSIFFELHNAHTNRQFERLDWLAAHRHISKEEYVRAVEETEHANAFLASRLIEEAIRTGYFPAEARWPIPQDFEFHFRVQQESGHSGQIAALYDRLQGRAGVSSPVA